ncbi:putative effector protein [Ceratobasidium theobromae]|uniref:Putative effector protein n=1 Tax=Ceratobasidium theobromae TaxID=1582974 RepID=A0A5N5QG22_9AGAM|nr:putative effector protein [Ceratobasidium theobromae]
MRGFTVFSTFVAVAATGVMAIPSIPSTLLPRQDSMPNFPPQCREVCAKLTAMSSCGSDTGCMCTNEMGQNMYDCGYCGINSNPNDPNMKAYKEQFDAAMKAYTDTCTKAGHPVGPFTASGSAKGNGTGGGSSGGKSNGAMSCMKTGAGSLAGVAVVLAAVL